MALPTPEHARTLRLNESWESRGKPPVWYSDFMVSQKGPCHPRWPMMISGYHSRSHRLIRWGQVFDTVPPWCGMVTYSLRKSLEEEMSKPEPSTYLPGSCGRQRIVGRCSLKSLCNIISMTTQACSPLWSSGRTHSRRFDAGSASHIHRERNPPRGRRPMQPTSRHWPST